MFEKWLDMKDLAFHCLHTYAHTVYSKEDKNRYAYTNADVTHLSIYHVN